MPLWGCDRQPQVRYYQAPKDRNYAQVAGLRETVAWTAPAGWKRLEDGGDAIRFAIAQSPSLTARIIELPGDALQQSLERWGSQAGLDFKNYPDLSPHLRNTTVNGAPAFVIDFASNDGQLRYIIAAVSRGQIRSGSGPQEVYWCALIAGPSDKVEAQRAAYESLVGSLRFWWQPMAETASVAPGAGALTWKLPEGWQQQPTRPMSYANFAITRGAEHAEAAITRMSRSGFEQMKLMNINRWRGQVGLPPVNDPNMDQFKTIRIAGREGLSLDLTGPTPQGGKPQRLKVAWFAEGDDLWFVRLQATAEFATQLEPAFEQFIQSLRFDGKSP